MPQAGHGEQGSVSRVWAAWAGQAAGQHRQQGGTGKAGRLWAAEASCGQADHWSSAGRVLAGPGCTEAHHCAYGSRGGQRGSGH